MSGRFQRWLAVAVALALLACGESAPQSVDKRYVPPAPKPCGKESEADFRRLDAACKKGDSEKCLLAGQFLDPNWCSVAGIDKDLVQAALRYEKGCIGAEPEACWMLNIYMRGTREQELELAEAACRAGVSHGCYYYADTEFTALVVAPREEKLTPETGRVKAKHIVEGFRRACALGHSGACGDLGAMGVLDWAGSEERKNARALMERSCDDYLEPPERLHFESFSGCVWLATAYWDGHAGDRAWGKARALEHRMCEQDASCDRLTLLSHTSAVEWPWWLVEALVLVAANLAGAAYFLVPRLRRPWTRRARRTTRAGLYLAVLVGLFAGVQVAFYFWGSRYGSPLWLLSAGALLALPVHAARHSAREHARLGR